MDLRELRFKARMTQWELTKLTGISQTKISLMEKGHIKPSKEDEKILRTVFKEVRH